VQEIDVSGLVCLFDAAGPCGNAVKDSQPMNARRNDAYSSVMRGAAGFDNQLAKRWTGVSNCPNGAGARVDEWGLVAMHRFLNAGELVRS
jgi:hypothetical protein